MQDRLSVKMMGTFIDLVVEADNASDLAQASLGLLETYKNRFSANDMDSELSHINLQAGKAPVQVHPDLFEVIQIGKAHSLASPGHLNIALGPLIQTWRIGFSDARLPQAWEISQALALSDPHKIQLQEENRQVFLQEAGMKLDLGALAKGYIADKVLSFLKREGARSALINLGGNVLVFGPNPNRPTGQWVIGLQDPQGPRGQNLGHLIIQDQSVVTSGVYERHLRVGDKDYHHIFDPKTGYPVETQMASLTIVADQSLTCEIWSTRLFGLDLIQAMRIIEATPAIEGILITQDQRILHSSGLNERFHKY